MRGRAIAARPSPPARAAVLAALVLRRLVTAVFGKVNLLIASLLVQRFLKYVQAVVDLLVLLDSEVSELLLLSMFLVVIILIMLMLMMLVMARSISIMLMLMMM